MLLDKLEKRMGYAFRNRDLLIHALRHSSYINEHRLQKSDCNERLEFLGDAVLEMVSSEYLYLTYPERSEGQLSKLRASLVCEQALAASARAVTLEKFLLMGKGEELSGGRNRDSIISDAFEATIGAMYLDGGLKPAKQYILTYVLNDIENKRLFYDSKTVLQERVQGKMPGAISYRLAKEEGPDHDKSFSIDLYIGEKCYGTGTGHTKKAAEQMAAYQALQVLESRKEQ